MKRLGQIVAALAVCAVVIMSIGGCEEENLSNIKRHRLIADENRQLKKELELCDKEIERQKELHKKQIEEQKELHNEEIKKQKELYDKRMEMQKKLHNKKMKRQRELFAKRLQEQTPAELQKTIQELKGNILRNFEEIIKLREENKKLKAQIEELKK